ncbi:DNA replication licensing factor Mcm5 [Neodiprion pinetum]|uniref:DNA replication licensing factor MCM5 n=1 Tax=Neodiprion lecontei TaxID=441921 RepID=A0A6J0BBI6_NEOLC|nr:DNA replication licensing factor Mcm5 [Neodiprion lecontei]XP_046433799.1 DNA replication licensing factor Mcm5 [Neodiprion fabricii]XP_046433800.1 DNA replication licensing factor Mcm5 [Neodiprion fabricii]XP_046492289.1 DNA replication licensing factor Mcm5 [Neodiprion pinetum]XP_046492290.1 DNA replication licensing factor Mcm5 [Neodiprion pinetum]XP_046627456.1 DNA replication licensing factor Mcm5 [Neodiprion virginianus]XP_046627457.1 DNA replication licensing factor Mcm5 [Neodiprion
MEGFDRPDTFFVEHFSTEEPDDGKQLKLKQCKQKFKEFIRQFHEGNFNYKYRDALKRNYNLGRYWVEVNLEDLAAFDESLAEKIYKQPLDYLPVFEEAATDVADELTAPRPQDEEKVEDIQVLLSSDANATPFRGMKHDVVSKLVKVPGIVISASGIRAKATRIAIQCRTCRNVVPDIAIQPGFEGYQMPRKCNTQQTGTALKCPLDPYFIIPDKCRCVDFQVLKLQELPDNIPQGEVPRHLQLYCDRYLCERVVPGNRVLILGIYSIKKIDKTGGRRETRNKAAVGVRAPYIRVVGISVDGDNTGSGTQAPFTAAEEDVFRRLAADPEIYDRISRSIAPSIFGAEDMKKAIGCLLFGGSRKKMPDGLCRRGDINILMLGDPGTAKSQLLKFVERVAPVAVYTSGKGSSAAGLTASVTRDPSTRNFVMEGGAMVLADGGVVCIDEFDKMKEDDRVAIHEAMEQQTISIAKAGITTTLNSRCSVLAAANSIFGRWDDTKGEENIDFMPTILSRFDMIFIVKDEHDQAKDITLAKHVMKIHTNAGQITEQQADGELSLNLIKKYIHYCRTKCGPRISKEAGEKLKNRYVMMRSGTREHEKDTEKRPSIPITVRQLEAIIRITESLAKMRLQSFATENHVNEALRLFQVSTLDAAMSGSLDGAEGFTTDEEHEMLTQIEKQLKRRFAIGSQVSEQNIVADFTKQKYPERAIYKVIHTMIRRGELQHRMQRKMLYRLS